MPRFAALLGSINVGGNRLKMDDLKAALEEEGFARVATVVASGNVLFDHDGAPDAELAETIARIVKEQFAIDSFAAVRSRAEMQAAVDDNPFAADGEEKFVHTVFLAEPLDRAPFEAFAASYAGPERLAAGPREIYIDYAVGVGRSTLDPAMRKAKLPNSRGTARNIRSIRRIIAAMED